MKISEKISSIFLKHQIKMKERYVLRSKSRYHFKFKGLFGCWDDIEARWVRNG